MKHLKPFEDLRKDLKTIKGLVKYVLENFEKARNDDNYLYLIVCELIALANNNDLGKISVINFFLNLSKSPYPPFESVRRSRQKLQREFPHLSSCEVVSELRAENEEAYREFARS